MQDFNQYVVDAMREEGISDAEISTALGKIASNEKLSRRLGSVIKTATEDYTAQLGRERAANERAQKWEDWGKQAGPIHQNLQTEYQKALTELEQLRNGGRPPDFDPTKYMTKADMAATLDPLAARISAVVKETTALGSKHALDFKEVLDLDAVDRIAKEKGLPISAAYQEYIAPRKLEQEVENRKKWEADKTAEIERDLRSRLNVPADAGMPSVSTIFQRPPAESLPKDVNAELMSAWNSVVKSAA